MVDQTRLLVEKQVDRVRRRLFIQVALQSLVLCWAIGLLATTLWFLLRPFTLASFGDDVRWGVPLALLGVSTVAGVVLAWLRRPSRVVSSLALDEKFGLKERVTTFLSLNDQQLASPAGQALLSDVTAHLSQLEVASAFPIRLSLQHVLMPTGAFILAAVACLVDPILSDLKFTTPRVNADQPKPVIDTKHIQEQLDNLKKVVNQRNEDDKGKSEALKELEKEFEKLVNQPLDKNEEKIRERMNEFHKLSDKLKDRVDGLREKAEKSDQFRKQLKELGLDKDKLQKDGPAKDFQDALMKGNFDKARAALDKLAKDLKNEKLDEKQLKQLQEQFKELNDQLKKQMENDEVAKQLKKDLADGKLSKKDFDKAMEERLKDLKDLKDLNDVIADAKEALEKGGAKEAGEKLDKLKEHFEQIELTDDEIRNLLRDQDEINDALRLLGEAFEEGEDDGMGGGRRPGGRRPISPNDPNSKTINQRQKAELDAKGTQRMTGFARGGNFNKIPAKAVDGAFRQAVQEAPEALERQRIPDDAADIARKYFERLGGQR